MTERILKVGIDPSKAESGARRASASMDKVKRSAKGASGEVGRLDNSFDRAKNQVRGFGGAIASVGLGLFAKQLVETRLEFERIERTLKSVTGSIEGAGRELQFVKKSADDLGLSFQGAASQYAKMSAAARGTSLEGRQMKEIFTAVSKASVVLGMNAEQTTGTFRALEQMISKGNVQAEELRGQLGERLTGAFQLAAKAMGVTTQGLNKMLDDGEVLAEDLLPKLAKELEKVYGEDAIAAARGLQAEINRIKTAWFEFKNSIIDGAVGEAFTDLVRIASQLLKTMTMIVELDFKEGTLAARLFGSGADRERAEMLEKETQAIANFQKQLQMLSETGQTGVDLGIDIRGEYEERLQAEIKASQEAEQKKQKEAEELNEKAAEKSLKIWEDAAGKVQDTFADAFKDIFDNGLDGFGDLANKIKNVFSTMLAEMAAMAFARPVILSVIGGMGGPAAAMAQPLSGGGFGGLGSIGQLANFGGFGDFGGIGATISGGINTLGANLGFGGATPSFIGPMPAGAGVGANAGALTGASLTSVLGAAGLGYFGGNILGGIGGNQQAGGIGGAGGAAIGMMVGGPVGALIGGALGGLVGGFMGGGGDYPFARADIGTVGGGLGITGGAVLDAGPSAQINQAAQMIASSVNQFANLLGATGVSATGGNIGYSSGHFLQQGFFGGGVTGIATIEEAIERSVIDLISKATFTGISPELSRAVSRAAGTEGADLQSILRDFEFAKGFLDGTLFDPDSMTQAEQAIAALNSQFDEMAGHASRLGLSLVTLESERAQALQDMVIGFNDDIQKQILAFTDPLQLQMDNLVEMQELRVKEATALGADLVEVERLGAMEREGILRDFNSDLQQLLDDLTIGGAGVATPAQRLSEAEALFSEAATAAAGGSGPARAELAQISRSFLEASEAFFGSSEGYIEDFNQVTSLLGTLLGETPRFAAGGITSGLSFAGEAGPEAVVPLADGRTIPVTIGGDFSGNIVDEIRRLSQVIAAMEAKGHEIQIEQSIEIRDLNQKLERLAGNIEAGGY